MEKSLSNRADKVVQSTVRKMRRVRDAGASDHANTEGTSSDHIEAPLSVEPYLSFCMHAVQPVPAHLSRVNRLLG